MGIHGYSFTVFNGLTNISGTLFFANGDALHGFELWKSDGTLAGTALVKDIRPGSIGSFPGELTNVNGTLFFRARGPDGQAELWKSDGTEQGTVLVVDLTNDGDYHFPGSYPRDLANVGGTLYFRTDDGSLWKSDGTAVGTVPTVVPSSAVEVNSALYYLVRNADFSYTLRTTDEQGVTKGLKTFPIASNLTNVAGTLYLAAKEPGQGTPTVWKTDGTSLGTVRVGPLDANVADLINVGGRLFFTAVDPAAGRELWKSDGTPASTFRVRDIMPGQLDSSPADLRNVAGILYFTASNGVTGDELWRSNGTFAGTYSVKDLVAGAGGSHPEDLLATDRGALFFNATTAAFGKEPYALLPAANTAPVLDNSLDVTFGTIDEDSPNPASRRVQSLVATAQTDADANALKGIAVTGASQTNGRWQFSLDDGASWQAVGNTSEEEARLLPARAYLRFVPNRDFFGVVKLYYRAWDQTEGTAGGLYTTKNHFGGRTAFSAAFESAAVIVRSVNDAPVLILSGSMGYVRDTAAITLAPNATVTDVDSPNFSGGRLRVRITTDGTSASNRLLIGSGFTVDASNNVLYGSAVIGQRTSNGIGTNELIVVFNAHATPAIVQQLVRAITFKTVGGAAGLRSVVITVSDGDGGVSADQTKTVNVM